MSSRVTTPRNPLLHEGEVGLVARQDVVDDLADVLVRVERQVVLVVGVADAERRQDGARLLLGPLLPRPHEDEERDDDEDEVPAENAEKAEGEGDGLSDAGGDPGGAGEAHLQGQARAQDPAPVHRERRE
ncbi:MAG: hypothetical protein IPF66_10645 [Holophagales bacterium]|nr:hypothetical protein [Holophagales bacterium]